jgi:hypothetical protein
VVVNIQCKGSLVKGKLDQGLYCRPRGKVRHWARSRETISSDSFSPGERTRVQTMALPCRLADSCPGFRLLGNVRKSAARKYAANRSPHGRGGGARYVGGSYLTELLTLNQGIGNGCSTAPLIPAGAAVGALAGGAVGYWIGQNYPSPPASEPTGPPDLVAPRRHQFDLSVYNQSGFTGPGSVVRVREFNIEGNALDFSSLGLNYQQMPTIEGRFWFTDVDALDAKFRYLGVGGHKFQSRPIFLQWVQNQRRDSAEHQSLGVVLTRHLLRASPATVLQCL